MRVQKLGMLVSELHMLVIAQSEAAAAVAKHARRLSMQQLQQLQVCVCVCNVCMLVCGGEGVGTGGRAGGIDRLQLAPELGRIHPRRCLVSLRQRHSAPRRLQRSCVFIV
eukprot:334857-Chlamydomonas_euryale.AAC.10